MSNSSLVTYTRISPNKTSPRKRTIDTITIHVYVGQVTAKRGCDNFYTASNSCNYVVGYDGSIGLCVEEKDRSWCSGGKDKNGNPIRVNGISGADNDHRAVTIEVASETVHPYKVTDAAYKSLIKLVADICKRNNIKELKWKGDKSLVGKTDKQNMTVHRWFANKACPGDYLYNLHGQIAKEVNAKLKSGTTSSTTPSTTNSNKLYRVQVGAFSNNSNAVNLQNKLKQQGYYDTIVVKANVGSKILYRVQVGAFSDKTNAQNLQKKLKTSGFDAIIVEITK